MSPKVPDSFYIAAPKLNEFNILSLICGNSKLTQAELARRCDLSVAMVNNYMKMLCAKGLLEYHRRTIKTVTYHITTLGRDWLEAREQELLREAVDLFAQTKDHIRDAVLRQAGAVRNVVVYGCGHLAELTIHSLTASSVSILGVCDDDPLFVGRYFCGMPVQPFTRIHDLRPDAVVIAGGVKAGDTNGTWAFLTSQGIRIVRLTGLPNGMARLDVRPPVHLPTAAVPDTQLLAVK
jgi:predicted transcriptional regulator